MNNMRDTLTRFALRTRQLAFCLAAMVSVTAPATALSSIDLELMENSSDSGSETTFRLNGKAINITISETNGLTVSENNNIRASQKGHFVAAGSYLVGNRPDNEFGAYIHTLVFDINHQQIHTYKIEIKETQNHTISIIKTSATEVKASEALCSANIGNTLTFVNVDTLGMLTQYMAIPDESDNTLTVHHLRTLAIGPGIKSCALGPNYDTAMVSSSHVRGSYSGTSHAGASHVEQTLYLADEYAGVWAMPANEEAEVERTLIFNQPNTPVEGVATFTSNQATSNAFANSTVTAWVSPDHNGMWLHNTCATTFFGFDKDIAPEDIALSVKSDTVYADIYDDNSGSTFTTDITHAIKALYACKTNQASLNETPTLSDTLNKTPIVKNENLTIETPITNDDVSTNKTPMFSAIELKPIYETDVVENYGDAADDPAIWVNQNKPSKSLVIGTNKKGSLNTYNLQGKLVASHKVGRVNNVGVAYDWGPQQDIAVASNRSSNSMSVFFIDKKTGELTFNSNIPTPLTDIYGLCVFSINNHVDVLVNSTDGRYLRYRLNTLAEHSRVSASLINDFNLPSQPEGCVVDTDAQIAYLGEEEAGIWALDISEEKTITKQPLSKNINRAPTFIIPIEAPVVADIEGLSLFDVDGVRYLIASSQGNNQYAVYESKTPYGLVGMVSIGANYDKSIDGVSETDGLETTNVNLNGPFKSGLLVVQDGRNVMPSERQNFKLVAGGDLADAIRTHKNTSSK